MALPASDNFNRADENPAAGWTTVTGASNVRVVSNALTYSTGSADNTAYWAADTPGNDQYSEFTFPTVRDSGPCVRMATGAMTFYIANVNDYGSKVLTVTQVIAGTWTNLGSNVDFATLGAAEPVRIRAIGTTISVNRNGSEVFTITDSGIASGRLGAHFYGFGTVSL